MRTASRYRKQEDKTYFVYFMASQRNGTLYIGMTSDLIGRVIKHKNGTYRSFTKKYNVKLLVYYESTGDVHSAIQREKQLKAWRRKWKIDLIEKHNPEWLDLFPDIT